MIIVFIVYVLNGVYYNVGELDVIVVRSSVI
jgi:hypothetical protein